MSSVFIQYAEIKGVPISSLRFVLNGERINGAQTADGLELNDQDVIDCFSMRSFLPNDYCPLINALTHCANCNKETEPFMLKMCTSCRFAHYCNDDCQQMHHKEHIQQCKQHAQDLKKQVDAIATNRRRGKKRKDKNDDADKDDIQESKTEDHSSKKHRITNDSDDDDDDDVSKNEWKCRDQKGNSDEIDDEFQPILPKKDCPICKIPLPIKPTESTYNSCCGNFICRGCDKAYFHATRARKLIPSCAFCREPSIHTFNDPLNEELNRIKKRMELNDSEAIYRLSAFYSYGEGGLPKDPQKGFELCLRTAKLVNSNACNDVAIEYRNGTGVPTNMAKAKEYEIKAANKGCIQARHYLGIEECKNDNDHLACRHWLL